MWLRVAFLILALALVLVPLTLGEEASGPSTTDKGFAAGQPFETEFEKYVSLPSTKALAVAIDSDGAWASGWSYGQSTPEKAERAALRYCRRSRPRYSVEADCQVIAVDGLVVRKRVPFRFPKQAKQRTLKSPAAERFHGSAISYEVRWVNGTNFVIGSAGDLQLWVAFVAGRDPQALVYLVNGSGRNITFAPESISAVALRSARKGVTSTPVKVFAAPEYERKVRNKQAWQAALHGAAVAMANQPQPQSSTFSGNYSAYRPFQPQSEVRGTYYGQITYWPTAADYSAAWERSAAQMQAMGDQLRASFDVMAARLMRTHTLAPGTFYGGVVHLARFRGDRVDLSIPFGGAVFQVQFTMP